MNVKTGWGTPSLAIMFKALSDETRLRILYLLEKKPLCVCEIMGALNVTQTKTSRHLIYLKNAGILEASKEDRWMVYRIREDLPEEMKTILENATTLVGKDPQMNRIEDRLETILTHESIYRQVHGLEGDEGKTNAVSCPSQRGQA